MEGLEWESSPMWADILKDDITWDRACDDHDDDDDSNVWFCIPLLNANDVLFFNCFVSTTTTKHQYTVHSEFVKQQYNKL